MATNDLKIRWASLLTMMLAVLWTQPASADAPTSDDINNAILLEGSIPVSWVNDAVYPWTVEDGWVKSGNVNTKNTSSSLAFSYNSDHQTEVTFNWWNNNSNSNYHWVRYYVDGAYKGATTTSSQNQERFYLPKGNHVVEIVDSIGNNQRNDYFAGLKNLRVKEITGLEKALLTPKSLPITFQNDETFPWMPEDGYVRNTNYSNANTSSILSATISIDKPSKLSFERRVGYSTTDHYIKFFINGKLYNSTYDPTNWSYLSVVLQPGEYLLEWEDSNSRGADNRWSQIRNVELHQDWVDVDITPGTLGIEVLYKVDVLKDVELLKINGTMNDSDWATIKQMTNLHAIDLSESHINSIPNEAFKGLYSISTVTLPDGLQSIGANSFQNTDIYYLTIPSTVTSIGTEAFYGTRLQYITFAPSSQLNSIGFQAFRGCTWLEEFIMPNSVTVLRRYNNYTDTDHESSTFKGCTSLRKIVFSDNLESIPYSTCSDNTRLVDITLPSKLKNIEHQAFINNTSLEKITFPKDLAWIGNYAFQNTAIDSVCIPLKLTSLGYRTFQDCKNLKYVELPSNISSYDYNFNNCTALQTVVCPSATPPVIKNDPFYGRSKSAMTLVVPSFAVVNYKLDDYWYNFGNIIEGNDIDYWKITGDLSLVNNRRMEGKPDVDLSYGGRLTVSGNAPMTVGQFNLYFSEGNPSRLLNSCNAFTADSINTHFSVAANTWYFITPLADVEIKDVKVSNTESFVFRYFDGEYRASVGSGSSWRNVTESKLKAGQGYIFQCNAASVVTYPVAVELHDQILSTEAVSIPLVSHPSDNAANRGWNYVGNRYPCYYDIYYMDFTAPVTVWDGKTYRAYSIADDNYVLRPMQGFFVQKPDAVDAIVMQTAGKQLASTVNRASYAPAMTPGSNNGRLLYNLELITDSICDYTRVVLNEKASLDYEIERDATKFMSMDEEMSQIYTLDNQGNRLSINERPEENGSVRLGLYAGDPAKRHTVSIARNDGDIYLHDTETDIVVNLAEQDYTFTPSYKGYIDDRFLLLLSASDINGVDAVSDRVVEVAGKKGMISIKTDSEMPMMIYGIDGKLHESLSAKGDIQIEAAPGLYIVKAGNASYRVIVK